MKVQVLFSLVLSFLSFGNVITAQEWKLIPSDGMAEDEFGIYVSISGDYAVVGADFSDINGINSGAAYVFVKEANQWVEQAKLIPDDGAEGDWFGKIVSISGDYILITAYNADENGTDSGAAYVFKRDGDQWVQQAKLLADDGAPFDAFGISGAIYGDYAIIGSYSDDDNGFFSGSAYIFKREGETWIQQAKLLPDDGEAFDKFGRSVALRDDFAAVCGVLDDDDGEESGSVYVFNREGAQWLQQAKLTAADADAGDRFGRSLSFSGDYLAIGAVMDEENGVNSGSAYIFKRNGNEWYQQTKIFPNEMGIDDLFGYALFMSGDYLVVSAHLNDEYGSDSGSAFLYHRSEEDWIQLAKLTPNELSAFDGFGISVGISSDHIICGAAFDADGTNVQTGSAYIFDLNQWVPVQNPTVVIRQFKVFPVPAKNFLTILNNEKLGIEKLDIFDIQGKNIMQVAVVNGIIDISNLLPGKYIAKATVGEEILITEFITMH